MIKTEFMELLEELDSINEATLKTYRIVYYVDDVKKSFTVQAASKEDAEEIGWSRVDADSLYVSEEITEDAKTDASKKFWAAAKNKQLDEVSFHAAFDDELRELGLMDVFKSTGAFRHSKVYRNIKAAKEANPDSWAVKALSKLWALRYVDYQYFESEKAEMRAEAEREAKERAEEEARWAEKERLAKEQRAAQIEGYNKLLQTYISKVDPAVIAAYEKAAGVSVSDDVVIKEHKVFSSYYGSDLTELGLFFGTWGHYYKVGEKSINNESKMLDLLTKGLTEATRDLRIKKASERFKDIDVIAANKSATVILLGESGTMYELNSHQRTTTLRVNGKYEPADTIEEPYEVIYAHTSWSDGNHSTTRDSVSQSYYSWNSKYADKLEGKIPKAYGRANGYLTSYIETAKVDGAGSVFSHADGIDSWAVTHCVACATD